jgi:hypothetical protein
MTEFSKEEINVLLNLFQTELGLKVSEEEACKHAKQMTDLLLAAFRDHD